MAVVLAGCFPFAGVAVGSGRTVTKNFDLSGFTAIDASSAFQIDVTQSESFTVSVTADDNLWDHVVVRKDGDTLVLGLQPPGAYSNTHLSAKVSMPTLSRVNLSGASGGTVRGFKSQAPLTLQLSGASHLSGDVQASNADFGLSGASNISLTGAADSLRLEGSGACNADLSGFAVNSANVQLSGASKANVNVKNSLDYELSGASHLTFTGNPHMGTMNTSGASNVTHQ
jgi:hypothetical protein